MDNNFDFSFRQSDKKSYVKIEGDLSPEKVYDVYSFLRNALSSNCRHLTIDLKRINHPGNPGTFQFLGAVNELKRTVKSVEVLGVRLNQSEYGKIKRSEMI